jgi:hypothetical protein
MDSELERQPEPSCPWPRAGTRVIAEPWHAARLVHARPRAIRLPFTAGPGLALAVGPILSLYEACRLVSGRVPYPPGLEIVPSMALMSGGADKPGYHHQRPHARRGRAAFVALKGLIDKGEIAADMAYLSPPTTTSDGEIDWLNTKVRTSDVAALCAEKGWRIRFTPRPVGIEPVKPVEPVEPTQPHSGDRRRPSALDKLKIIEFLKATECQNCDQAVALAGEALGLGIEQKRGRRYWIEAGRHRPRGYRPREKRPMKHHLKPLT